MSFDSAAHQLRELRDELSYNPGEEQARAEEAVALMNDDQTRAFEAVRTALDTRTPTIFFIDGPGGAGKSFLFEALLHYVRGQGDIAVACAWSGLAASLRPGGRTCHARFGFPVPLPRDNVPWNVAARSGKGQLLRRSRIIVWDEIALCPAALDAVNHCLRDLCQSTQPFGGKVVVLGGDLRQTLPELADRAEIVRSCITRSNLWMSGTVHRCALTVNMRAALDEDFRRFVLNVGDGRRHTKWRQARRLP